MNTKLQKKRLKTKIPDQNSSFQKEEDLLMRDVKWSRRRRSKLRFCNKRMKRNLQCHISKTYTEKAELPDGLDERGEL